MAAALEDKMTLTFRNEMTEMKKHDVCFCATPVRFKAVCGFKFDNSLCSRGHRCKYPISCSCLSGETWTSLKPNKVERILLPSRFCEFYDFVADPRVPLLLGSQDNEFNPYVDAYETSSKDVCEPEYNEKAFLMRASRIISPKIDVKPLCTSFAPKWNFARKWATSEFVKDNVEVNHEVFKNDSENSLGIHDDKEEEIAFLDSLLEDENFFEMNDKKVGIFSKVKTKKILKQSELRKRKSLQVFHPDIELLDHLQTTSYVG
ncbi:hypothetical protein Tco_0158070 [Tanacetum coccineum]